MDMLNEPWWAMLSLRAIVLSFFGLLLPWFTPKENLLAYINPGYVKSSKSIYFINEFYKTEDGYDSSLLFNNAINTLTTILFASIIISIIVMLIFFTARNHHIPQISIGLPSVTLAILILHSIVLVLNGFIPTIGPAFVLLALILHLNSAVIHKESDEKAKATNS